MIIGNLEAPEKLLIYRANSYFSVKDLLKEKEPIKQIIQTPTNITLRTSTLSKRNNTSFTDESTLWPKINNQFVLKQLKMKQEEQLKPFFLAKSKFLSKLKQSAPISDDLGLKREKTMKSFKNLEPINRIYSDELNTKNEEAKLSFEEEILIKESKQKCNEWLDKHVIPYFLLKPS